MKEIGQSYLERIQESYSAFLKKQNDVPVLMLNLESGKYVNSLDDFAFLDRLLQKVYLKGITEVDI